MKFLACHPGPQFSVHDVYTGWVEALTQLGQHVAQFNLAERLTFYDAALLEIQSDGDRHLVRKALSTEAATELAVNGLYAALYRTRPDVLLSVSGFFLTPELLDHVRRSGTRIVMVHTESPYEDDRQLELAGHVDLNLVNDPLNIERFAERAPSLYVPHAYRPAIHHPGPAAADMDADLAFVGTGYRSRMDFFEAMDLDGLDVLLAGNWKDLAPESKLRKYVAHDLDDCLDNATTADVYRSARVGMNLYRREAQAAHLVEGLAMGPREVELAACGSFFLRDPRPESDHVLSMLPTFAGPEDAAEQVRFWLGRPDERRRLGGLARQAVLDRTFTNHAAALLRIITNQGR